MGCDIHIHAEINENGQWKKIGELFSADAWEKEHYNKTHTDAPFDWRAYNMFALFADVRNYNDVVPIDDPRGIPLDACDRVLADYAGWEGDAHSASWLSVKDLVEVDYEVDVQDDLREKLKDCLSPSYFTHLEELKLLAGSDLESVRIVFWFDN